MNEDKDACDATAPPTVVEEVPSAKKRATHHLQELAARMTLSQSGAATALSDEVPAARRRFRRLETISIKDARDPARAAALLDSLNGSSHQRQTKRQGIH